MASSVISMSAFADNQSRHFTATFIHSYRQAIPITLQLSVANATVGHHRILFYHMRRVLCLTKRSGLYRFKATFRPSIP